MADIDFGENNPPVSFEADTLLYTRRAY